MPKPSPRAARSVCVSGLCRKQLRRPPASRSPVGSKSSATLLAAYIFFFRAGVSRIFRSGIRSLLRRKKAHRMP